MDYLVHQDLQVHLEVLEYQDQVVQAELQDLQVQVEIADHLAVLEQVELEYLLAEQQIKY